jgi:hypothetical protein
MGAKPALTTCRPRVATRPNPVAPLGVPDVRARRRDTGSDPSPKDLAMCSLRRYGAALGNVARLGNETYLFELAWPP